MSEGSGKTPTRLEKLVPEQTRKVKAVPRKGSNALLGGTYLELKLLCVVFRLSPELVHKESKTGGSCQSLGLLVTRGTWDWGPNCTEEVDLHLLGGVKRRD